MEPTFIVITDLSEDANILFISDSVQDILGYTTTEVQSSSAFDYFHPNEVSKARAVHQRGVLLDKAAVLHTVHIKTRSGGYEHCECTFTIVKEVLIASVGIYRPNYKSDLRASDAPRIRQLFKCSPRDPMYHMLEQLSPKYQMPPMAREPRAVLILNRFTRRLVVMFASESIREVMGIPPAVLSQKSFYDMVHDSSLNDAVECFENAKSHDSIAYLRFWSREDILDNDTDSYGQEEEDSEDDQIDFEENIPRNITMPGGVQIKAESPQPLIKRQRTESTLGSKSRSPEATVGPSALLASSVSAAVSDGGASSSRSNRRRRGLEMEAVVSCTSDGIAVVIRIARPPIPVSTPASIVPEEPDANYVLGGADRYRGTAQMPYPNTQYRSQ